MAMITTAQILENANVDAAVANAVANRRFELMGETPVARMIRERAELAYDEELILESMNIARETKRLIAAMKNAVKTK
ncbi:hypothetical protein HDR66_03440 [bacterium]|nr:hypothetical protein [bacterium]